VLASSKMPITDEYLYAIENTIKMKTKQTKKTKTKHVPVQRKAPQGTAFLLKGKKIYIQYAICSSKTPV
jgi:hypothetical protein